MFFHALGLQSEDIQDQILGLIPDPATGLDTDVVTFDKGGVNIGQIFDKYIKPTIDEYIARQKGMILEVEEKLAPKKEVAEKPEPKEEYVEQSLDELVNSMLTQVEEIKRYGWNSASAPIVAAMSEEDYNTYQEMHEKLKSHVSHCRINAVSEELLGDALTILDAYDNN